ncbi:MAG TPA: FtsX-like permease family protein, partial [Myxococcales bacterium]|nr:FtsX-like permease family protein [Myxococcales bacterium]
LASRLWPRKDPIGQRLRVARAGATWRTVVGVAGDIRERFDIREAWYLPYAQNAPSPASEVLELMVRSRGDPLLLVNPVRGAVAALDPSLAVADANTMQEVRATTLAQERVAAQAVSVFAALGLALAAVGTYGVMAYAVARRTRELAIRVALGAQPRALLQLVLGQGIGLGLLGVVAGLVAAALLRGAVVSRLTEPGASDPRVYAAVSLLLLCVAAAASWIPARRVLRVDPALALRAE